MSYKKTLVVKATTACNLNCPYCYNYKHSFCRQDISEKTIDKILDVFKNRIQTFTWHGGEPLLIGKEFFDKMNEKIQNSGQEIQISLQTNGVLIDEDFIELFKKHNVSMGISFDGMHNNRTRKNNEKIFKVFSLLKKHNIKFGCLQVLSDESTSSLIDEYEFAKKNQLDIKINTVFKANGNDLSYNLNGNRIIKETCEFFDYWIYDQDNPQPSTYLSKYINLLLGSRYHFCENTFCVGGWFSISPNGDIYPCGRDWEEDFCFCNIHEVNSIDDIYKTVNYQKFLNISKQLTSFCMEKKCPFFTMCSGGCYARHINWIKESGKFEVEPQYCYAHKKILTYIFNKIKNIGLYSYKKYNPWLIELLIKNRYVNIKDIKKTL